MLIPSKIEKKSLVIAGIVFFLGILALIKAFGKEQEIEAELGGLILWTAVMEIIHGFRRSSEDQRKMARRSAYLSIIMGLLLVNSSLLISSGMAILIGCTFLIDAINYLFHALKEKDPEKKKLDWLAVAGNIVVVLILVLFAYKGLYITLSIGIALRIFGTGLNIITAKVGDIDHVSGDLLKGMKFGDNAEVTAIAEDIEKNEAIRAPIDKYWIVTFILVLFFIHLGRMGLDRSFLGLLSPILAVVGDLAIALILAYGVIAPLLNSFQFVSSPIEMKLGRWVLKVPPEQRKRFGLRNMVKFFLKKRLTMRLRLRKAGYSFPTAIRTGLKIGLPWAAIIAAIMPVLGMSWYFDTENWASGVWDTWAANRTDIWRTNMTKSTGIPINANSFKLNPVGVNDREDFSFVVIGDPGEGDASQLILKDMVVKVSEEPLVKFVVISSDVIYPTGAMKDYERKFYLPMKGVTKPVYAIPGNHDWYDALEGFAANFYEPKMAKLAMEGRVKGDLNLSSSTSTHIDHLINSAAELRKSYGVPTGFQQAPYFQVSTGNFVLLCIDTGVKRQLDSLELAWVRSVLENSKGKFVMALLGHPFYAIGEYEGSKNPEFEKLHRLLRSYNVPVVMAGDTHDLEYYVETEQNKDGHTMHHFVNGGGGAYLSIGTAMAKAEHMPTKNYAFYPSRGPLVQKIENNTAWYKYPAWWYTIHFDGWPFSAEWLSAAFDYNVSPFFQSFMEIRVEKSRNQVVFIPFSQNGRLAWKDITSTEGSRPKGATPEDMVQWTVPLNY